MFGKNCSKKVPRNFFIFTRISCPKNWGKNTRNNFSRNKQIVLAKYVGSKFFWTKCEKTYIYTQDYREQKVEGKNPRKYFSWNTRIVLAKNVRKESSERSAKNVFYIHTNIVTKKWEEKTRENFFPEKHELCEQKILGKIFGKKC